MICSRSPSWVFNPEEHLPVPRGRRPALFGLFLLSPQARAWFAEGHQVVAIIAADDLTPGARSHVAEILGVADDKGSVEKAMADDKGSVEKAMAAASIRPDTDFRDEDKTTRPWHFIDICLRDKKQTYRRAAQKGIASRRRPSSQLQFSRTPVSAEM